MPSATATEAGARATVEISEGTRSALRDIAATAHAQALIAEKDAARRRLDETVELLAWAIDLRRLLYFGLDLDDMARAVADLKRAAAVLKRGARP